MGKLEKFEIELDNLDGVYYPGQSMTGSIVVELSDSMKMRCIHLTVLGRSKTRWSEGSSKNRRHYRSEEVYINDRVVVAGSEQDEITLPAGSFRYPFSVAIPQNSPSSFEGAYGYVRYVATATIDKPWKFDHVTVLAFTVVSLLDLNLLPFSLREPSVSDVEHDVSCCCCVSGNVNVKVTINKQCFVPGESIVINAEIDNQSSSTIERIWVKLQQNTEYLATSTSFFSSGNHHVKINKVDAAELSQDDEIRPGTIGRWADVLLVVPALAPSNLEGCSIINLSYVLKFYTDNGVKIPIDITIGSLPLRDMPPVVTTQPTAPSLAELQTFNTSAAPPSYEECVHGRVTIKEDGDSEYVRGNMTWAPKYPMYRQLSYSAGGPSS